MGGIFLGAGWIAMSFATALWHPYVFYGTVAALGMSTAYVPCGATVTRWFSRRRGLAAGLASAGGSLGAFVLLPSPSSSCPRWAGAGPTSYSARPSS